MRNLITDISVHFTPKVHTITEINQKLDAYIKEKGDYLQFDFSEPTTPHTTLHHCFLPEQVVKDNNFSTEIYDDFLHPLSEHKVCWFGTSGMGITWDRIYMLENIHKLGGISLFIGDIVEGVETEYKLASELGINIIHIP